MPGSATRGASVLSARVVGDTPAHRALVSGNEHGLLYQPDEPEDAAAAVKRLFAEPALAQALGGNARRRIAEEFSHRQHVHRFIELFDDLIVAKPRL